MDIQPKQRERGQGLIEYALIMVLIAIVVVLVLALVGDSIVNLWNDAVIPLLDVFSGSSSVIVNAV